MKKSKVKRETHVMRHGFIYPIATSLINALNCINLVELFKLIAQKLAPEDKDIPTYCRIAIDLFILTKWAILISLWILNIDNIIANFIITYLLVTNIFTYFYRHLWVAPYDPSEANRRSRFINLILAITYNIACFGYLYDVPFKNNFDLDKIFNHTIGSMLLSLSHTFFSDFSSMVPTTSNGYILTFIQIISAFLFISIILSVSLPQFEVEKHKNH